MKKLLSTILAVSLIISATACNGQKDDRTDFTTRATETAYDPSIKEPDQTINTMSPDQTTESAGTTESSVAQTSKYTYTVYAGTQYETVLSMDIDIDKYLIDKGEKVPFFAIASLGDDLGWYQNGTRISESVSINYQMPANAATLQAMLSFNPANPDEPSATAYTATGDLNADGTINVVDATLLIGAYLQGTAGELSRAIADVNHDGVINVIDATEIISIFLHNR